MDSDCPKIDASEIASISHGITSPQSVIRIRSWSTPPPRKPAIRPTAAPTIIVMTVADSPTSSEILRSVERQGEDGPAYVVGAERVFEARRRQPWSRWPP